VRPRLAGPFEFVPGVAADVALLQAAVAGTPAADEEIEIVDLADEVGRHVVLLF